MPAAFAMNSYVGKQILALVRDGDYAHAGEEEAIERALAPVPKDAARHLLDAGCGRGGTAAYRQEHGWGHVTGIDIEPRSIDYARQTSPGLTLLTCDILDVGRHVADQFDLVTMFNVLYALPDQAGALRALASRAKPGAHLVLFEYVDLGGYQDVPVIDDGKPFLPHPPVKTELRALLEDNGWQLQSVDDLTSDYARWYRALVAKIEAKRSAIEALAGPSAFEHVLGRYAGLLAAIEQGHLGGATIYADKSR
jgi:SAM-dependent methyltransferase